MRWNGFKVIILVILGFVALCGIDYYTNGDITGRTYRTTPIYSEEELNRENVFCGNVLSGTVDPASDTTVRVTFILDGTTLTVPTQFTSYSEAVEYMEECINRDIISW